MGESGEWYVHCISFVPSWLLFSTIMKTEMGRGRSYGDDAQQWTGNGVELCILMM